MNETMNETMNDDEYFIPKRAESPTYANLG